MKETLLDFVLLVLVFNLITFRGQINVPSLRGLVSLPSKTDHDLVIVGLGDILFVRSAAEEGYEFGFSHFWDAIKHLWIDISEPKLVIANFEGVTGNVDLKGKLSKQEKIKPMNTKFFTNSISSGGFNYHPSLVDELTNSGIDTFTLANNHAFDRGFQGINTTRTILNNKGFTIIGTKSKPVYHFLDWVTIQTKGPWSIATIGCTTVLCSSCRSSLNAPEAASRKQILDCKVVPDLIAQFLSEEAGKSVDVIVVAPHWGVQYKDEPPHGIIGLAQKMVDAGAHIIIGNHPHVPQKYRTYQSRKGHVGHVLFSLGSLTSGLGSYSTRKFKQRASAVAYFTVKQRNDSSQLDISFNYTSICETWDWIEVDTKFGRELTKLRQAKAANSTSSLCRQEEHWIDSLFTLP